MYLIKLLNISLVFNITVMPIKNNLLCMSCEIMCIFIIISYILVVRCENLNDPPNLLKKLTRESSSQCYGGTCVSVRVYKGFREVFFTIAFFKLSKPSVLT